MFVILAETESISIVILSFCPSFSPRKSISKISNAVCLLKDVYFLRKYPQQVTCGDMTNGEKEDATQTKVSTKIKNLLNLEISESSEPSLSFRLAVAFVTWISSVLPSE